MERTSTIDVLVPEWEALAERRRASLFCRPGWYAAWWKAFGSGVPELVTVRRDGGLVAVAPMRREGSVVRSMTNWHTVEFSLLAEDERAYADLVQAILAGGARRVTLEFVTVGASDLPMLEATASQARHRTHVRTLERSPYLPLEGDWESYEKTRERHLFTETRRRRRRLEELGSVSFEIVDGREDLDRLLEEVFRIEGSGWKSEQGTAMASRPETRTFYTDVAHWAAERDALRLAFLRLDGRPLAVQYLLEDGGTFYLLKGGYDIDLRKYAPGTLLIEEVLSYAFEKGLDSFEFLGFDEPFKRQWTDQAKDRVLFQAFAPSVAGQGDWAAQRYGRPLAKRLLALSHR